MYTATWCKKNLPNKLTEMQSTNAKCLTVSKRTPVTTFIKPFCIFNGLKPWQSLFNIAMSISNMA